MWHKVPCTHDLFMLQSSLSIWSGTATANSTSPRNENDCSMTGGVGMAAVTSEPKNRRPATAAANNFVTAR